MLRNRLIVSALLAAAAAAMLASAGGASAPPVGPLPAGPTSAITAVKGQLVAVALPHRAGGRVWRIARPFDARVLGQVAERDVGSQVVLVFKANGVGSTTVTFVLTRGERSKAYESRRYKVGVHT